VERACKPDSVHPGCPGRDRHSSGPGVAHPARCYLPASSPRGTTRSRQRGEPRHVRLAYLVLLRAEIARFTRTESARLCCSDPHLGAARVAPAGLSVERCYLLRCPVQSGRSSSTPFRVSCQRRSGALHDRYYRRPAGHSAR